MRRRRLRQRGHAATETLIREYPYRLIMNTGASATYLGVDYLSGAGTTGPATDWWREFPYHASYLTCSGNDCLTPGVYTAQIRYRITAPAGTHDIAIPVRMTVTP
jgi:hypothetical protein